MEPDDFLRALEKAIRATVEASGGVLEVCEDDTGAILRLEQSPSGKWLCLLVLTEGRAGGRMGDHDTEKLTLTVYVGKALGLHVRPGAAVHTETAAGPPLLSRVGLARRTIQSVKFVEAGDPTFTSESVDPDGFTYTGWKLLPPEEAAANTVAARLTFTITAAFDAPGGAALLAHVL